MLSERTIPGSEGEIFFRMWKPEGAVKGIVSLVHGYAEHGGRYAHVAERLVAEGFLVVADDHIGHGRSCGERALIADFEHVVDDLGAVLAVAQAEAPGAPVVMAGHSMGGLLTARFAQRNPGRLAGTAFLGAVIGDWDWARNALSLPELPPPGADTSGMSRDAAACQGYDTDPLVYHGEYKRGLLEAEVVALDRFQADLGKLTAPVAFLHGVDDPFVPYQTSLKAVEAMPAKDKVIHLYQGARHELVNETNRDEVIADLLAFVRRVTA